MIEALETIPGVEAVATVNAQPLGPMVLNTAVYTAETAEPGPTNSAARSAAVHRLPRLLPRSRNGPALRPRP